MRKFVLYGLELLTVMFLMFCTVYAQEECSAEIVSQIDGGIVTIKGAAAAENKTVLLIVYKPDKGPEDILKGETKDIVSRMEIMPIDAGGRFYLEFVMEDEESGEYTAYFKAGEKIWKETFPYTAQQRLREALEKMNKISVTTSEEEMQALYQRYWQDLRLPDSWFTKLSAKEQVESLKRVFQQGTEYKSGAELCKTFAEEVFTAFVNFQAVPEDIHAMMEECEDVLLFESDEKLFGVFLTAPEQRTKIFTNVLKKREYENLDAIRKAYTEFSLLQAANDIEKYSEMHGFLEKYQAELGGISFTDYSRLSTNQKKSVDIRMTQTEFDDLLSVKEMFEKYVKQAVSEEESGSNHHGGCSGGGSGSGGGGTRSVVSFDPEERKHEEAPVVSEEIFEDLGGVEWARDAITSLHRLGIVDGKSDKVFDPDAQITRSEFVKLLCAAMNIKFTGDFAEYSDVNADDWCWEYVQTASQNGLVQGNPDGSFGKDRPILRQDISVILYRALEKAGIDWQSANTEQFQDMDEFDAYAVESALMLRQTGIINGTGDNRFAPKACANRAEAAKMIYQFYIILQSL